MENYSEYYCLNIIANINFFISLNSNVNTILRYYRFKQETKMYGRGHEVFYEKAMGHEIFSSMIPWATK